MEQKPHLRIQCFLGTAKNAVKTQKSFKEKGYAMSADFSPTLADRHPRHRSWTARSRWIAMLAAVAVTLTSSLAHAAVNGVITSLTSIATTTGVGGGNSALKIEWTFPNGSDTGDTVVITVPAGFTISSPNPLPLTDGAATPTTLAELTYDNSVTPHTITITRLIPAGTLASITSVTPAQPDYTLSDPALTDGTTINYEWPTTNAAAPTSFFTPITASSNLCPGPCWYFPRKGGNFRYDATGRPYIQWSYYSRTGLIQANSAFIDHPGAGQEMDCSSWSSSIGSWDETNPAGPGDSSQSYAPVSGTTFVTSGTNAPACTPTGGFDDVLVQAIPASEPGAGLDTAGQKIYYMNASYRTFVTDVSLLSWSNTAELDTPITASITGKVDFSGTATGNRVLTITKQVAGQVPAGVTTFDILVECTAGDGTALSQTVSLTAGQSTPVYPATGADCTASEANSHGAVSTSVTNTATSNAVTAAAPLAITNVLTDTFGLTVTNNFQPSPFSTSATAVPVDARWMLALLALALGAASLIMRGRMK
jgi:hypothetical protein